MPSLWRRTRVTPLVVAVVLAGCAGTPAAPTASPAPSSSETGDMSPEAGSEPSPDVDLTEPSELLRSPQPPRSQAVRPPADAAPRGLPPDVARIPDGVDEALREVVDAAVADLARRLGVDPSQVEVRAARTTVWSDASLGCPEPGMRYAQVLTEGSVVEMTVDDTRYRYHSGEGAARPFPCDAPQPAGTRSPES